jgi:SAM-dependent MidA family methyltransferase
VSQLALKIVEEIRPQGAISFARFMELALYCPVYGYYEKEADTVGRRGDYYTSVSVGSLFGELLAFQFARWLQPGFDQSPEASVHLVEAGTHQGHLATDILQWLRAHAPDVFQRLQYWILEPSRARQEWQRRRLAGFADRVFWAEGWSHLAGALGSGVRGIIFSNELLDAFPVHRLAWDASRQSWFEWGVTCTGEKFSWIRLPGASPNLHALAPIAAQWLEAAGVSDVLPDGFALEVSPAASRWWKAAATLLTSGKLVAIDYGLTLEERFLPERASGTLRAYSRHQVQGDVLEAPGEKDLTAHVDFTSLQKAGEASGLRTDQFIGQAQFLTSIVAQAWTGGKAEWTPARRRQFNTLIHPDYLGRAFRVLVQSRPVP